MIPGLTVPVPDVLEHVSSTVAVADAGATDAAVTPPTTTEQDAASIRTLRSNVIPP